MDDSVGESFPPAAPLSPPGDSTSLAEISSWWEVACIAHYCHIFSDALELPTFDIEEFEIALLPSETDREIHPLIVNLHVSFLKGILEKKEIGPSNWELLLKLHFVWRNEFLRERYNPMGELSYKQLSTRTKVEMLYKLCHLRMELDDVTECIKDLEPSEMRLEEVGVDRGGNKLWYFYGMRLYRESKEVQQHNKRNKTSSSLRSRPADSQKKEITPSSSKVKHSAPRNRNKDACESEENCVSADDSCRQDSKRVTRSAILTGSKPVHSASQEDLDSTCSTTQLTCSDATEHKNILVAGENEFSIRTGWSVVCADMKDWSKLLLSLENSPHDCEVEFVEYAKRELVAHLTELDHDKKTGTIITMSDSARRVSKRLTNKLRPDYTSKQIDFSGVPEYNPKMRAVDELVVSENDSVDVDLEEKREREREEIKEKRELEWQEAYSGNLQGPRKKANLPNSAPVVDLEDVIIGEDLRIAMLKVVDELRKHEDCWLFVDPVTEAIAPGYHDVIKYPMDIVTVEKKLRNEEYSSKEQFVRDFALIFKNCKRYNGPDSEYTEMAHTIRQQFNKLFCKHFSQPGADGRARTPIPGIMSSSESDGEVTPFNSPGVKRRRRRKAEMEGSREQKLKSSKNSREDQMGFSKYASPFYPPYPPYHSDKVTGHKFPHYPPEFPPYSCFPPFMSSRHPPFPAYPPYWTADRPYKPHKGSSALDTSTAGSTKERREEEAKLQNIIRSQGLLSANGEVRRKREKVSSTTAGHKTGELSSPESVTPTAEQPADPVDRTNEEEKRTSNSFFYRSYPGPYTHMQHPYHNPYYPPPAPPYMDYLMDSYYTPHPFLPRQGDYTSPSRHQRKDKRSHSADRRTDSSVQDSGLRDLQQKSETMQDDATDLGEQKGSAKKVATQLDSFGSDSSHTPNPSSDQFSLAEVNTCLKVPSKTDAEEQPHSTTEEVVTDTERHDPIPEILKHPPSPLSSPDNSNMRDTHLKPHKPHFPYMYPHGSPYAPVPYSFYPPSPYSPHGYPHPSYDPYLADMNWKQQQSFSQGLHSSSKNFPNTLSPPQMDSRFYPNSADFMQRLPPYPGAPASPNDFPPYPYPSQSPLQSKHYKKYPHYETDVLPPPAGYSMQQDLKLPTMDDPSNPNVPNYKDSLADYALHLAGGKPSGSSVAPPTEEQHREDPLPNPLPLLPGNSNNNNNNNNIDEVNLDSPLPYVFDSVSLSYPNQTSPHSLPPMSRPNTLRSFFLPSAPRPDQKLDLLKYRQSLYDQWQARASAESRSRPSCLKRSGVRKKREATRVPTDPSEP